MEHIEQAGVHSGDSSCSSITDLSNELQKKSSTNEGIYKKLGVIGLVNAQFAVRKDKIFVLEVNLEHLVRYHLFLKQLVFNLLKLLQKL